MIDLKLLQESEPIELNLEENSKGGTNNYNDLSNKPKINGVELQGSLTLENLGIIVNAVKDILINGASIVKGGVANIPKLNDKGEFGLPKIWNVYGITANDDGYLQMLKADNNNINSRDANYRAIVPSNLDYAVKQAMCDGKGEVWTDEEKASARNRMGIDTWEEVADVTLEEEVEYTTINFEQPYKELYIYISQTGIESIKESANYVYPLLQGEVNNGCLRCYGDKTTTSFPDVCIRAINHNDFIELYTMTCNAQQNTTVYVPKFKIYDKTFDNKLVNFDTFNFYGLYCSMGKVGTRIKVWGVKA